MANSKYEYVRSFEQPDVLLANTWIVVRIDGRGFSKLTTKYNFTKPNDRRALDLMNGAAEAVMKELPDLVLGYGNSDEFSFVFHKDCVLFERRASKLTTTIVSTFTSYYTFLWPTYFPDTPLTPPLPSFDGRAVCYPSDQNLRDYMSWRQVDCHINNLYNTTFWALVQRGGVEARAAEQELSGTVSSEKNELLWKRFDINYNNEPEIFKKGSVIYRDFFSTTTPKSSLTEKKVESATPLSHPQPRKSFARPMSQPVERTLTDHVRGSPLSAESEATPRGPTFLSTSTTPSPPPSPPSMSIPSFPSVPQTFLPVSPPASGPNATMMSKSPLPQLTPIPLPPPTLKPSTKPPKSLSPPNPTARQNTSPQPSPLPLSTEVPVRSASNSSHKKKSHSASASMTMAAGRPVTSSASMSKPTLKHRSPSLSVLEGQPPIIPLRISSIPVNTQPRKLSLPSQRSFGTLSQAEKAGKRSVSPTKMMTMKELPSPPTDEEEQETQKRLGHPKPSDSGDDEVKNWEEKTEGGNIEEDVDTTQRESSLANPVSTPLRHSQQSASSNLRLQSAASSSYSPQSPSFSFPAASPPPNTKSSPSESNTTYRPEAVKLPVPPRTHQVKTTPPKANSSSKAKAKITEEGGWASGTQGTEGRPQEMSRTQRDKLRKKRSKARIVIEHVDVIKDEFWERRPWILSGRVG